MSVDYAAIALAIRDTIAQTPKKSKRVLLKTLLNHFGHKTRQKHWLDQMETSLAGVGLIVTAPLGEIKRDDWVVLSVTDPVLPVADFCTQPGPGVDGKEHDDPASDPWFTDITT